jgi:eukaryotic-like serine/threonine-protein kinase
LEKARTSASAVVIRRSVAVLGFQNLSRQPAKDWLSTAITEMMTTELAAGQQIRTVPGEDVSRMKISLALADADTYNGNTLSKIRTNVHTDDVVFGSYVLLGDGQIRIDVRVQDTDRGELLAAISEKGSEANIDDLVIHTGAALRKAFATAPITPAEAAIVTASMPVDAQAAELYARGLAKLRLLDNLGARDLLLQGLAIEPTFAPGHLALSQVWSNLGYDQKAREEARKAFDTAGRLSRPEQLRIEARYHLTSQEWEKAVEIYRSLFQFFPDSLDDGLLLAEAQALGGKYPDALGTVDQLRTIPLFTNEPRVDLAESEIAGKMGDFRRELSAALQSGKKAQRQGARLINAAAQREACSGYLRLGQKEDARRLCEESRTMFASSGDRNGEAAAMLYLARISYDTGDAAAGIRMMEETLKVERSLGNAGGTANALIYLGNFLDTQDDPAQAASRYEEAAQICRATANKEALAYALSNAAIIAHRLGQLTKGEKMYTEATAILQEVRDMGGLGLSLMNLGHILWSEGDVSGAENKYKQALAILEKFGEVADRATVRADLALVALRRGESQRAEGLIDAARAEAATSHDLIAELHVASVRAKILLKRKAISKAQAQVQEARSLVDRVPDDGERIYFSINAAQVGAAFGNAADVAHAKQTLASLSTQARDAKQMENQFEALLALGEIQLTSKETVAGRATLNRLRHDAEAMGFRLVARDANRKLSGAATY